MDWSPPIPELRLDRPYPSPFRRWSVVHYEIPRSSHVTLRVFDPLGRSVAALVDRWLPAGRYRAIWDGTGSDGTRRPGGVYFYRIEAANAAATHKVVLVR